MSSSARRGGAEKAHQLINTSAGELRYLVDQLPGPARSGRISRQRQIRGLFGDGGRSRTPAAAAGLSRAHRERASIISTVRADADQSLISLRRQEVADLREQHSVRGGAAGAASSRTCRRVSTLTSQKTAKLTIRNWITALRKTPMFKVTAPAFCASASVGCDGPFSVMKILVKSMPPTARPMSGVKRSLTRLLTTAVKRDADDDADGEVDDIAAHDEGAELVDPGRPPDNDW